MDDDTVALFGVADKISKDKMYKVICHNRTVEQLEKQKLCLEKKKNGSEQKEGQIHRLEREGTINLILG